VNGVFGTSLCDLKTSRLRSTRVHLRFKAKWPDYLRISFFGFASSQSGLNIFGHLPSTLLLCPLGFVVYIEKVPQMLIDTKSFLFDKYNSKNEGNLLEKDC
jgi:hypothetical protein